MTKNILLEILDGMKAQIESQEDLQTYLQQANAMVFMSGSTDFELINNEIVHHYLGALKDILDKANQLSEQTTQELCDWSRAIKKESLALQGASPG